jgi:hypothetical protein
MKCQTRIPIKRGIAFQRELDMVDGVNVPNAASETRSTEWTSTSGSIRTRGTRSYSTQ